MALDLFPTLTGQGFFTEKAPIWSTAIAEAASGRERRRKLWSYPRWRFKIGYEVLRDISGGRDLTDLTTFFNAHAGRYAEWGFLDPTDNAVTAQAFGIGDGTTRGFQLLRTVTGASLSFVEPVRGVYGTPSIYVNGTPTGAWTVDDNGVLTFTSPPAASAVLSWTGQFLFHCRFDQDDLSPTQMMARLWSLSGLTFMTVKR